MTTLQSLRTAAGGFAIAVATMGAANAATYENAADGIANAESGDGYERVWRETNAEFGFTTTLADFLKANDATIESRIGSVGDAIIVPGFVERAAAATEATADPVTASFAPAESTIRPMPRPAALTPTSAVAEPTSFLPPAAPLISNLAFNGFNTPDFLAAITTPNLDYWNSWLVDVQAAQTPATIPQVGAVAPATDVEQAEASTQPEATQDVADAQTVDADALSILDDAQEALEEAQARLVAAEADKAAQEQALADADAALAAAITAADAAAAVATSNDILGAMTEAQAALDAAQAGNAATPGSISERFIAGLQSTLDAATQQFETAEADFLTKNQERETANAAQVAAVAAVATAAQALTAANAAVAEAEAGVTNANAGVAEELRASREALADPALAQCLPTETVTGELPCEDQTVVEVPAANEIVTGMTARWDAERQAGIDAARAEAEALRTALEQDQAEDATIDAADAADFAALIEKCDVQALIDTLQNRINTQNTEREAAIAEAQAAADAAQAELDRLIAEDAALDAQDAELLAMACVDCDATVPEPETVETLIPTEPCGLERTLYNYAMITGHLYDLREVYNNNNIAGRDLFPTNNENFMLRGELDVTGLVYEEVQTGEVKTECPVPVTPVRPTGPGTSEQTDTQPVPQLCSINGSNHWITGISYQFTQQPAGNHACCPSRTVNDVPVSQNGVVNILDIFVREATNCTEPVRETPDGEPETPAEEPDGGCNGARCNDDDTDEERDEVEGDPEGNDLPGSNDNGDAGATDANNTDAEADAGAGAGAGENPDAPAADRPARDRDRAPAPGLN